MMMPPSSFIATCLISRHNRLFERKFRAFETLGAPYLASISLRLVGDNTIFSIWQYFSANVGIYSLRSAKKKKKNVKIGSHAQNSRRGVGGVGSVLLSLRLQNARQKDNFGGRFQRFQSFRFQKFHVRL